MINNVLIKPADIGDYRRLHLFLDGVDYADRVSEAQIKITPEERTLTLTFPFRNVEMQNMDLETSRRHINDEYY